MLKRETYFTNLVIRYLSQEASDGEILELKEWLNAGPENRKLFDDLRKTWNLMEEAKLGSDAIVEDEWIRLKDRIETGQKSRHVIPLYFTRIVRIAAIFLLIAVPSFFLYLYLTGTENIELAATDGMIELTLPDGTSVSLNKGSSIIYPEKFKKDAREVILHGEAYFNVKHLEGKKFLIHAGKVLIEDIGTAFYVNTRIKPGEMEVVLTEGRAAVSFSNMPDDRVIIVPGEKAEINLNQEFIEKSVNQDINFLAWKTRKLIFNSNTLTEVVTLLNRVYSSDIRITGENIENCRLTAIFDNQSLESVLNVIRSTLDVSVTVKGSAIEISGNSCITK